MYIIMPDALSFHSSIIRYGYVKIMKEFDYWFAFTDKKLMYAAGISVRGLRIVAPSPAVITK